MAPMTRFRAIGHVPNEMLEDYYDQRAVRAGTLIITEATFITAQAGGYANIPGIWSDEQIAAWSKVFKRIHSRKSSVFLQMWALGRAAEPETLEKEGGYPYVSASNVPMDNAKVSPRPLSRDEIKQYVQDFAKAAKNAIAAGADGVELHAANGYLPDQFLNEIANTRTDEYGGSIENRARFVLEIVDALIEVVGANRIGIRFSPWSEFGSMHHEISPIAQFAYVTAALEKRARQGNRLAYIHVVESRAAGDVDADTATGSNLFFRHIWQGKLIRAGGMLPFVFEEAEKDPDLLIGLGRYFIANPDLVDRLQYQQKLTSYNRDTFYINTRKGYTDYPITYEESVKLELAVVEP
jgi:NADPH2 dehydrogenase